MDIEENKKALKASIRKYRRTVKLLEDNLGVVIARSKVKIRSIHFPGQTFTSSERFVSNKRIPYGTSDCPLCLLYYKDRCDGCCIKADTGKDNCNGTPYNRYERYARYTKKVGKRFLNAAKKELEYLEGLYKRLGKE